MKKTNYQTGQKKPPLEVNRPAEKKLWQKQGHFSFWYFIAVMIVFYLFQSSVQVKRQEIPYSLFQKYLEQGQISECVIREKIITGTLKIKDEKTNQPRHFITVPLYNSDLLEKLDQHGVKFTVALENHFFRDLFLGWIIPFALIFLVWGFLAKKLSHAGMNFMNIGKNRAVFLGTEFSEEKNYSEETARQIDAEVMKIIKNSCKRVSSIVTENRQKLDALAALLEQKEVLSGEQVKAVLNRQQ